MKKITLFFMLFAAINLLAQEKIYDIKEVTTKPEYPGGIPAFLSLVKKQTKLPDYPKDATLSTLISFVIRKDGTLTDITVVKDPGYGFGDAYTQAIKKSARWTPGKMGSEAVNTRFILPVTVQGPANTAVATNRNVEKTYTQKQVDKPAEYPGGLEAFKIAVAKNLDLASMPKVPKGEYKFRFTLTIGKTGKIEWIEISKSGQDDLAPAIRNAIAKIHDKWTPAEKDGKAVTSEYVFNFTLTTP